MKGHIVCSTISDEKRCSICLAHSCCIVSLAYWVYVKRHVLLVDTSFWRLKPHFLHTSKTCLCPYYNEDIHVDTFKADVITSGFQFVLSNFIQISLFIKGR